AGPRSAARVQARRQQCNGSVQTLVERQRARRRGPGQSVGQRHAGGRRPHRRAGGGPAWRRPSLDSDRPGLHSVNPGLEISELACAAGVRTLFSGVSFTVPNGRWLALTGPNGTGKTTLLRAIAGLVRPTAGDVRWRGRSRQVGSPDWHAACLFQGHAAGWKDAMSTVDNLGLQLSLDGGRGPTGE